MSNTTWCVARFRMSEIAALGMFAAACTSTAHQAVVSAYQPSSDDRNAAKGGAAAWRPPV
jgi:hypothetical protein